MLALSSIMIGSENPDLLAAFYTKVLGKPDWAENGWYGWDLGGTYLHIGKHSEVKGKSREPQRILVNFETKQVKRQFAKARDLGATVIKEPYEMEGGWVATLADPDGNYFQFTTPWE